MYAAEGAAAGDRRPRASRNPWGARGRSSACAHGPALPLRPGYTSGSPSVPATWPRSPWRRDASGVLFVVAHLRPGTGWPAGSPRSSTGRVRPPQGRPAHARRRHRAGPGRPRGDGRRLPLLRGGGVGHRPRQGARLPLRPSDRGLRRASSRRSSVRRTRPEVDAARTKPYDRGWSSTTSPSPTHHLRGAANALPAPSRPSGALVAVHLLFAEEAGAGARRRLPEDPRQRRRGSGRSLILAVPASAPARWPSTHLDLLRPRGRLRLGPRPRIVALAPASPPTASVGVLGTGGGEVGDALFALMGRRPGLGGARSWGVRPRGEG